MSTSKKEIVIAATSDIHGILDDLDDEVRAINPHVLVIAGDIHPCRLDINADSWFRAVFFPMVREWANKSIHVVATPGNHDFWFNDYLSGNVVCELPPNFHLLCDEQTSVYGLNFYGTPWVPWINGQWCFEASSKTLEYEFSHIPEGIDVLIAHSPPLISHKSIDISTQHDARYQRHFGSIPLFDRVMEVSPRNLICGHIHSGAHAPVKIECKSGAYCYAHNVSRVDEGYHVAYPLTTIRVSPTESNERVVKGVI